MKSLYCALLAILAFQSADAEVISKCPYRNAVVVGAKDPQSFVNGIQLLVNDKVIWDSALGWGGFSSVEVAWSPYSKVAIGTRTTKRTTEVHVFDTYENLKEIPIPDIYKLTLSLNNQKMGRALLISPIGWTDNDTLVLRSKGNLVDAATDDSLTQNFCYQITLHVPTGRIVSVVSLSQHDLQLNEVEQGAAANP